MICSPIINGVMEDRLCGYGPPLLFYLKDDNDLIGERDTTFKYLDSCYDAAELYIGRFKPLRNFYAEDCKKQTEELDAERSKCRSVQGDLKVCTEIFGGEIT